MKQWKRVLGIVLAWCALSSVCAMGAESTVEKRDQESWKGTETKLMASHIAVDTTGEAQNIFCSSPWKQIVCWQWCRKRDLSLVIQ